MDSLKDWYRYLDEVSRPVRREGDEPEETGWRPWMPAEEAEAPPEMVPVEALPELPLPELPLLANPGTFLAPSPPVFRDLTVDDELQPMARFAVPELRAPTFELSIPQLRPEKKPEQKPVSTPPAAQTTAAPEAVPTRVSAPQPEPPARANGIALEEEPGPSGTMAPRYRELLSQIRSHDVAQNSYKAPFRETREELVQRLLDPPLTLEETARLLGVCPTTIRRYTNKGMLRHFRTSGNQRRFRLSDVLEFLDTRFSEIEADQKVDQETEEFRQNEARAEEGVLNQ